MIIQRLVRAIRSQAWATLLLELLVVVLGILIALQLDNWNEQRKQRADAHGWRGQILADLHASRDDLHARLDYYTAALTFGETALAGFASDQSLSEEQAWDIVLGAFQAGQISPYQLTGPGYREVQNAGQLGLVGDAAMLTALAQFYDVSAYDFELVTGGLPKYRDLIRERTPWAIQEYIWDADCQTTSEPPGGIAFRFTLVRCDKPPFDELLLKTVVELRDDKVLRRALVGRLSQLKVSTASIQRLITHVGDIIELMESGATTS